MAIFTPLQGTGGMSDATINAMLQSGDPGLVQQANDYIAAREQEIKERGADKGILGAISNLFGFSKLAAAEPNQQKFSNQFSVTQPSQFSFKPEPIIPDNVMAGSLLQDVVDTPTREFGQIRGGPESGDFGVRGLPQVQDLPVDFSELDDLEAQDAEYLDLIQKAREAESPGILQNIINNTLIGRGLDFLQDQFQYRGAGPSITGTPLAQFAFRNQLARDPSFNIAAALDKQNALGGYYSDFARGQRQLAGRFSNLLDRARSGKTFSERNLLGISRALGTPLTRDDISNIESGAYNLNTGDGPSGAGTFTAESLSRGFDSEEGPVGGGTGTMSASDFSDDTAGTPF
tara:strand:+ start:1309 stop:2346 length:1038 start_codon:yes stop_codon:yes gene_type:complete